MRLRGVLALACCIDGLAFSLATIFCVLEKCSDVLGLFFTLSYVYVCAAMMPTLLGTEGILSSYLLLFTVIVASFGWYNFSKLELLSNSSHTLCYVSYLLRLTVTGFDDIVLNVVIYGAVSMLLPKTSLICIL